MPNTLNTRILLKHDTPEKWNEIPEKAKEFFFWVENARNDILNNPINAQGLHNVSEKLEYCFGSNIVKKTMIDEGNDMKQARENKKLYAYGLTGGLSTVSSENAKKVKGHTFFGK